MICASLALLQIMFAVHRFAQGAVASVSTKVRVEQISPAGVASERNL